MTAALVRLDVAELELLAACLDLARPTSPLPAPDDLIVRLRARLQGAHEHALRAPLADRMLQFFAHEHLPPTLAAASEPYAHLAEHVVRSLPPNPERTVALRKLLESKDCAVRAVLYREPGGV